MQIIIARTQNDTKKVLEMLKEGGITIHAMYGDSAITSGILIQKGKVTKINQYFETQTKAIISCSKVYTAADIMSSYEFLKRPSQIHGWSEHKAPELLFCLQTHDCTFRAHSHALDIITPLSVVSPEYKYRHNGAEYDLITAVYEPSNSKSIWLGHWNDGVK